MSSKIETLLSTDGTVQIAPRTFAEAVFTTAGPSVETVLSEKESSSNKVTSISASSTDIQYPSAKCMYDLLQSCNVPTITVETSQIISQNPLIIQFTAEQQVIFNSTNPEYTCIKFDATALSFGIFYANKVSQTSALKFYEISVLENNENLNAYVDEFLIKQLKFRVSSGQGFLFDGIVELQSNKTTTLSAESTDIQYPSAKSVYDANVALQTNINAKQDTLVSGTNIKTINNESILGNGNLSISGLPTGTAAGNALIYDGNNWTQQAGYGYVVPGNGATITWDGVTTGRDCISAAFGTAYKVSDAAISIENLTNSKIYTNTGFIYNPSGVYTITQFCEAQGWTITSGDGTKAWIALDSDNYVMAVVAALAQTISVSNGMTVSVPSVGTYLRLESQKQNTLYYSAANTLYYSAIIYNEDSIYPMDGKYSIIPITIDENQWDENLEYFTLTDAQFNLINNYSNTLFRLYFAEGESSANGRPVKYTFYLKKSRQIPYSDDSIFLTAHIYDNFSVELEVEPLTKKGYYRLYEWATSDAVDEKSTVSVNSTGTSTNVVNYITVDNTEYKLPVGTTVEANPVGTLTDTLTRLKVGNDIYGIAVSAAQTPLVIDTGEIRLETGNGLTKIDGVLEPKAGTGITVTTNGINANIDGSTITTNSDGKLQATSVSVSATGTATDVVNYITINGTEKKLTDGYIKPASGIPASDLASGVLTLCWTEVTSY